MFDEPTFLIQIGHGGKPRLDNALENNHADGAILSPADYKMKDNRDLSRKINNEGGYVLFDPQFYIPKSDRNDLNTYPYFQSRGGDKFETALVDDKEEREALCEDIISVQENDLNVDAYIAPARFLDTFSQLKLDRWLDLTETFIDVAKNQENSKPIFASLPLDGKQLNDRDYRSQLLNRITSIDPDGFYVSVKYDYNIRYPLSEKLNVYSFLSLMASLRENQYEVLVGHTHNIAHLLFGLGVNAFASGHFKNLRSFDTDRWEPSDEDSFGRQTVRYYSDMLLSDIRVDPDLQYISKSNFLVNKIRMHSPYESDLFDPATTPEESGWKFSDASWDHYLWACNTIKKQYVGKTFDERVNVTRSAVKAAQICFAQAESDVVMMGEEFNKLDPVHLDHWELAFEDVLSELRIPSMKMALL